MILYLFLFDYFPPFGFRYIVSADSLTPGVNVYTPLILAIIWSLQYVKELCADSMQCVMCLRCRSQVGLLSVPLSCFLRYCRSYYDSLLGLYNVLHHRITATTFRYQS